MVFSDSKKALIFFDTTYGTKGVYHLILNLGSIKLGDLLAFLKIFMAHQLEPINIFSDKQYVVQSVHVFSFSDIKVFTNFP